MGKLQPCEKCAPQGGLGVIEETVHPQFGPRTALKPCSCEYGQALEQRKLARQQIEQAGPQPPVLGSEAMTIYVEMLAAIPFFPPEAGARIAIGQDIGAMCRSHEEAMWLVRQMRRLHGDRWPGPAEMRRVYCATLMPLDLIPALGESEKYPENNYPLEREHAGVRQLDQAVNDLAKKKQLGGGR